MRPALPVLWLAAVLLLGACLLPEAGVVSPRYFTPVRPEVAIPAPQPGRAGPLLRLRRVRAAAHLRERIVWRRSDAEFGFHELRRWTQPPAQLVERWLARELFEDRGLRRALAGAHPVLELEVQSFDEVLQPDRAARVQLLARLTDPQGVSLHEQTYSEARAIEGRDPAAVARAMGDALARALERVGDDVEAAL
jgi:ABC-type uncharacterized transport system auxiliary subunit